MILVLSWTFLRCRYRLTHIGGMALGLMSVVVLVWVDIDDGKGGISSGGKNILGKNIEDSAVYNKIYRYNKVQPQNKHIFSL